MATKSLWDQIEKWQQGFLSSIYYLYDFKTCCQDYTQKYASFIFADALVVHNHGYFVFRPGIFRKTSSQF